MATGQIIVDTHHHLCAPSYVELVAANQAMHPYAVQMLRNASPQKSLEDMDKGGVTRSIISLTTPGVWFDAKSDEAISQFNG